MNYGELKTAVATDSHRTDLDAEIPRFIRETEGMIRRELRALSVTGTIDEADRVSNGLYNLPTGIQSVRAILITGTNEYAVSKVSVGQIKSLATTADPLWYAIRGSNTIEFRGIPGTDTEFDIEYLGHPTAFADDSDTNTLLTDHEALYVEGSLFYLYKHTQDIELAQAALDTYQNILGKLNELEGRKQGGASSAGAYNLYGGEPAY